MKTFELDIRPYHHSLTVHRGTFAELVRWADRVHPKRTALGLDDCDAAALSLFLGGQHVLWLWDKKRSAAATRADIVHEVVHIATRVLEQAGMRLTRDSEEAYAYLQADLYSRIATRLGVA